MTETVSPLPRRWFAALTLIGVLLNATGLFPPIMEPDGALYACIAKTMAQSNDFVNLYAVGADWLDKPHFPFWMVALSFKLFGINTVAYKLPALLFFLLGVFYTYRFARLMYPEAVAQVAALVMLTAFHGVLSNSDVRAEPYLTGLIIGAVYHFWNTPPQPLPNGEGPKMLTPVSPSPCFKGRGWGGVFLGSFFTGCALMTKGIFVLVPIGAGLVLHWLLTGQWRELLKPRWYMAVVLSFLFTLPEVYCLYQQFDLHPEKIVFGRTGVSGLKFFLWDSQFGRFFNTGPIKGEGDKLFFVHTTLWAFLPWSLPLYVGLGRALAGLIRRFVNRPYQPLPEYVSLGSGLATFTLFSLSGFQLPHYMNIVFPFFAIITAQFMVGLSAMALRRWAIGQSVLGALLIVLTVSLILFVKPAGTGLAVGFVVAVTLLTFSLFRQRDLLTLTGRMVGAMVAFFGVLNLFLYPTFLQYQAGMTAARYVNSQPALTQKSVLLYLPGTGVGGGSFWSYEFYANGPTTYVRSDSALRQHLQRGPATVFTEGVYADSLRRRGFQLRQRATFPFFHVSTLNGDFLNPDTRPKTLEPYVLAEVSQ